MKKRPIIIIAAVAALSVSVLLLSRNTVAYLMDTEAADNVVQIGQVEVSLDEGSFDPTSSAPIVEIGRIVNKSPKLKNTGKNDEYVFLQVDVPKENVTLLYETSGNDGTKDYKEGEKIKNQVSLTEVFKMKTEQNADVSMTKDNDPAEVFYYHAGNNVTGNERNGWILLGDTHPTEVSDSSNNKYSRYIFGYNKKLKVNAVTETLFDKVQLKSFIDGEVAGNTTNEKDKSEAVNVTAYAIQADDLNLDSVNTADNAYLNATALGKIWTIVNNKNIGNG